MFENYTTKATNHEDVESELELTTEQLKSSLLPKLPTDTPEYIVKGITNAQSVDELISQSRHVEGLQLACLKLLKDLQPEIRWYRGGDVTRWRDIITEAQHPLYTEAQLDTPVIDMSGNGVMGRRDLAEVYALGGDRSHPSVQSLSIDALIEGTKTGAIRLVGQHGYDLRVERLEANAYLEFCQKHLKVEPIH